MKAAVPVSPASDTAASESAGGPRVDREAIRAAWLRPVALVPAVVIASLVFVRIGPGARGVIAAGFAGTLVVLAAIDLRHRLIPNRIVLPATALVLLAQTVFYPSAEWAIASLGAALFLFLTSLITPGGLGMGDVKLALLLGAMLGTDVVAALLIGFLSVWPVAMYLFARHGLAARKRTLPFGPPMAFGAILVLLLAG